MKHDWVDIALGIGGIAGSGIGFLVVRYLSSLDALRKEIKGLRADTANIRGHLDIPPWPYDQ